MKKTKKLLGMMMMLLVLTLASTSTVSARANLCDCGGSYNRISTITGSWSSTGETRQCNHNMRYGLDHMQRRRVTENFKCNGCGNTYSAGRYEYRWLCKGTN